MNRHPDGSITFPMRGPPPKFNEPNYTQDPDDAYRWILNWVICKYRILNQKWICSSGRERTRDFCSLIQLPINPKYCSECNKREP